MGFSAKHKNRVVLFIIAAAFFAIAAISSVSLHKNQIEKLIWADAEGYYQYLPSLIIKNDVFDQPYSYILPDGRFFNKYTYGVALMESPFFLTAYIYSHIAGGDVSGYSSTYGFAILFAAVFYVFAGMLIMFGIIKKIAGGMNAFIALMLIFFGTNLYYYTVGEPGMSHAYSFFLFAAFIKLTQRFYEAPSYGNAIILWIVLAVTVLVRPVNALFGLWFLLYDVNGINAFKNRIRFLFNVKWMVLSAIPIVLILFLPQNFYWYELTGKFWVFPYQYSWDDETFRYILEPKIFKVLFGLENGWFLYSPLILIALSGFFFVKNKNASIIFSGLLVLITALYINSSWWKYTFGGALGYRSMIEYYPLLAILMAHVINKIIKANIMIKVSASLFFILLIFANIRISFLYNPPWDGPDWTWDRFFEILNSIFFL